MTVKTGTRALVLSLVLAAQALTYYVMPKDEYVPIAQPLTALVKQIGDWALVSESKPEQEIQDLLKADDAMTRVYRSQSTGKEVSMFVAFFRTQRAGVQPHSPKVCLPGSGWTPEQDTYVDISIPGRTDAISVNRYIVSRGELRSVVLYWYQTPHRVVANEFAAKFYLVWDSLRFKRSDTSLVRVIAPVGDGTVEDAQARAVSFIQASFDPVRQHLPL
ncbi:MAG: EpsI family protein [Bryobacterales bacterium]|nr:EpsI family protein [Bryobacterales bacterium]